MLRALAILSFLPHFGGALEITSLFFLVFNNIYNSSGNSKSPLVKPMKELGLRMEKQQRKRNYESHYPKNGAHIENQLPLCTLHVMP